MFGIYRTINIVVNSKGMARPSLLVMGHFKVSINAAPNKTQAADTSKCYMARIKNKPSGVSHRLCPKKNVRQSNGERNDNGLCDLPDFQ